MIRLYLDEDLSAALASALRSQSLDVLTTPEAGHRAWHDADQLAFAAEQSRTICTANQRDFTRLHRMYAAEGRTHSGIVIVDRARDTYGAQARGLARLSATLSSDEMMDRLEFLNTWLRSD